MKCPHKDVDLLTRIWALSSVLSPAFDTEVIPTRENDDDNVANVAF